MCDRLHRQQRCTEGSLSSMSLCHNLNKQGPRTCLCGTPPHNFLVVWPLKIQKHGGVFYDRIPRFARSKHRRGNYNLTTDSTHKAVTFDFQHPTCVDAADHPIALVQIRSHTLLIGDLLVTTLPLLQQFNTRT